MGDYFCGWYLKCQSDTHTLAVIPAVHRRKGRPSCSIQLITGKGAWSLPFLECRHSVVSMYHTVTGALQINGERYCFEAAAGYIEGDRGRSFPGEYAWTQCSFPGGSLMLSVAEIPLGPMRFTGVIGVILWQGRQYRLATYLGAKIEKLQKGEIVVCQGGAVFSARLLEKRPQPLLAPVGGEMNRTIHESAACRACYRFAQNGRTLFAFETQKASFEYEYSR